MEVVFEDDQDEQEEQQSGSGFSVIGGLVVAGAIIAALLNQPALQVNSTSAQAANLSSVNQQYVALARQDASTYGIDPDLFVRQIYQESSFIPTAQSPAGAEGIAQFMPATAAGLGIDPWNVEQSLLGAAQLMASNEHQYGSYDAALACYNAGCGAVDIAMQECGSAWESCLPQETQDYIRVID